MKKTMSLVLPFVYMMYLGGCSAESASVGIVGGADGPTAVFVTSKINWTYAWWVIGAIVVTILVIRISCRNNKKK